MIVKHENRIRALEAGAKLTAAASISPTPTISPPPPPAVIAPVEEDTTDHHKNNTDNRLAPDEV